MNEDFFIFLENPIPRDINDKNVKIIDNGKNNNKVKIKAILQDVGNKNRNGRIYTREDMLKIISSPRLLEQLNVYGLKGEAGHPSSKETGRQATIDPTKVSHRITKLYMEGNYIMGEVMASGPYGKYFDEDIREGEFPAFSFRGIGTLEKRGGQNYAKISVPVTWDRVYYPSHKCAYMQSLTEGVNTELDNQLIMTESSMIKIENSNKVNEFIKDESKRLKRLSEALDLNVESVTYNKFSNTVTAKSSNSNIIFKLDDYVIKQLYL